MVALRESWLVETAPSICDRLVYLSQPLPDKPEFILYRFESGADGSGKTCFGLHKDLLRLPLQENPKV